MLHFHYRQLLKHTEDSQDEIMGAAAAADSSMDVSKDESDEDEVQEIDNSTEDHESSASSFQVSESDHSFEVKKTEIQL